MSKIEITKAMTLAVPLKLQDMIECLVGHWHLLLDSVLTAESPYFTNYSLLHQRTNSEFPLQDLHSCCSLQ